MASSSDIPDRLKGPGVLMRMLHKGEGRRPKRGDQCLVHYIASVDGKEIDNTYERDLPLRVELGAKQVVRGWEVVLDRMRVGDRVEATIPSLYAYGAVGCPPFIPPHATVVYQMELIDIE